MNRAEGIRLVAAFIFVLITMTGTLAPARAAEMDKVGVILFADPFTESFRGLKDGLVNRGTVEGENITYHVENLRGDISAVPGIMNRFRRDGIDVVFATTTPVVQAILRQRGADPIPLVFNEVADPEASGIVESLSRPGNRITGVSHVAFRMLPKRLEIFHDCFPGITRFLAFMDPDEQYSKDQLLFIDEAVQDLGVTLEVVHVDDRLQLINAVRSIETDEHTGIFMLVDTMVMGNIDVLVMASKQRRIPLMVLDNEVLSGGGTLGYSPSFYRVGYQSAGLVSVILDGIDAGFIPVQYPETVELVINRRMVDSLGLSIDESCYVYADRVIN